MLMAKQQQDFNCISVITAAENLHWLEYSLGNVCIYLNCLTGNMYTSVNLQPAEQNKD